jgi:hypothetical protein
MTMPDFSLGDALFILLILGVVHGIMQGVGYLRRRKAQKQAGQGP